MRPIVNRKRKGLGGNQGSKEDRKERLKVSGHFSE